MNKTKTAFVVTFLVIVAFMLVLSFYFTKAKKKKLKYLYQLGDPVSRSIDEEPQNAAIEIRFSKNDDHIITLLNNGRVELWDLNKKTRSLITKTDVLFDYCAAKDLLVAKENNRVYIQDIVSDYKKVIASGAYKKASIDGQCNTLALSGADDKIEIRDLPSGLIKAKFNSAMPVRNGLALSPDGTKVAAAEGVYHEDKRLHETLIEVWDVASGSTKPIFKYDKRNDRIVVGVWNILFSADSAMIAFDTQSAGESGITLMGLDGNTTFAKSGFKSYWMRAADYFDAKNYLATGDEQRNLVVWDIKTKGIGFYNKLPEVVESVSFSNDGSMLAAGIADSTIQVFSTEK